MIQAARMARGGAPDNRSPRTSATARPEAPGGDEYEGGDNDQREVQQPVAELDPGIEQCLPSVLAGHDVGCAAPWPVRAAEAGRAEPDRGAGRHDHRVGDDPG